MEMAAIAVIILINNFLWMVFYSLKEKDNSFMSEVKRAIPKIENPFVKTALNVDSFNNDKKYKPVGNLTKKEAGSALKSLLDN